MILILVLLFGLTSGYTFGITKTAYNGTVTFDGLFKACQTSFKNGKPCTRTQLYDGGWKQNIPISWILDLDINCLGFTTDSTDAGGTVFSSKLGYAEMVTCDMYFAVCCYY